jgi:hypothetical protein
MMWKRNRNEVRSEVEQVTETTDSLTIPLTSGDEPTVWNLETEPRAEFLGNIVEAYGNIANHAAKHSEELDYYAFDLNHELVKEDEPVSRLALTEHEAWDLSVALVQEMAARKDSEEKFKKIVVVINGLEILNNQEPEDADLYQQFRGYMRTVQAEGADHGIHLMFAAKA